MKILPTVTAVLQDRLLGAIETKENEIRNLSWKSPNDKEAAEKALAAAKEFCKNKKIDRAWNQIHIIERNLALSMNADQIDIKANLLRVEASKIKGWREDQIRYLVPKKEQTDTSHYDINRLLEAMTIRNDFYTTRNHKLALHKVSILTLTLIMFLILVTILILAFTTDMTHDSDRPYAMLVAGLFGALGAGFSIANLLFYFNLEAKIPEQLRGIAVTVIRFMIGATAAIIVLMLYRTGLLNNIFAKPILDSPYFYIVISFIAGFSERWVTKILAIIVKDQDKE